MSTKNDNTEVLKNFFNKAPKVATEDKNVEYKPFAPTLPVVNIIPSSVKLKYAKEKIINKFLLGIITLTALFLVIWGANFAISGIQKAVNNNIVGEINGLQAQVAKVEPFQRYLDGIELTRSNMAKVFAKNIDMGTVMTELTKSANANNVTITSMKISESTSTNDKNTCVNTNPFSATDSVGCISLTGTSTNKDGIINFFKELNKVAGFSDAAIASIGASGNTIVFTGTVNLTQKLYINKFGYLTTPIDEIFKSGGLTDKNISNFNKALSGDTATTKAGSTPTPTSSTATRQTATPTPTATAAGAVDPQFLTCSEAIKKGYGPYKKGVDFEYAWYEAEDTQLTGIVCEAN